MSWRNNITRVDQNSSTVVLCPAENQCWEMSVRQESWCALSFSLTSSAGLLSLHKLLCGAVFNSRLSKGIVFRMKHLIISKKDLHFWPCLYSFLSLSGNPVMAGLLHVQMKPQIIFKSTNLSSGLVVDPSNSQLVYLHTEQCCVQTSSTLALLGDMAGYFKLK